MITTLKDDDGRVIAYCEWRLVGQSGYDKQDGDYIWINDFWIHESYRGKNNINMMIDEVMKLVPDSAKYCYFQRRCHNNNIRIFTMSTWERRRCANDAMIEKEI